MSIRGFWKLNLSSLILVWMIALVTPSFGAGGFLEIHKGYFWDPIKQEYFIPRGIAYQLWNPPVGANQSFDQLRYDLEEFKKMHVNSVRCEIVWGEVETAAGVYDWRKPDFLIAEAERLGLKLFILIGFQYPPSWFPKHWRAINNLGLTPEVMRSLATNTPANALNSLSADSRECLRTNLPPAVLSIVANCLVSGSQAGSLSNVLNCLEANVPSAYLPQVLSCLISDVINYEHPQARLAYQSYMAAVTGQYRNSTAIGGWILGNEYAYFDLWEDPNLYLSHRFIGYDSFSQASFRQYLSSIYQGDINALNARWGTSYGNFEAVIMAREYPSDRNLPGYHDLIQWRKKSVGDFVALGAVVARNADPNHLTTYSMVGGIFNGRDANNTCEDARAIVARCAAAGAPLDFWSINNYANAAIGSELRSADFGVGKYQAESGLPVMISETGHSSTEDLFDFPDAGRRQAKGAPGQLWESLISGAIGTHLFHWNDRNQFQAGYFLRERGFGIVHQNRSLKQPVHANVLEMFRRMENLGIDRLLGGSVNPVPDIQIFWSTNADMGWPRANQENASLWGALKRLGYQPGILDDRGLETGGATNAPALLLSRAYQMNPQHLDMVASQVVPAGIHIHAEADLPGQFDAYHRPNPNWVARMDSLFGINVSGAFPALDAIVTNDFYGWINLQGTASLGPVITLGYAASMQTWKIWHGITLGSGQRIATHSGHLQQAPGTPALVIKTHPAGQGKTAINTFALGDVFLDPSTPHAALWDFRSDWLSAIYSNHFRMTPRIHLAGAGAKYVISDYRVCANGSILISLLNEHTNSASVNLSAPTLLSGLKVENLTQGGIVQQNSNGQLSLSMEGDDFILLYAYRSLAGREDSLVNSSPEKIWIQSAPTAIWPNGSEQEVSVAYDTVTAGLNLVVSFEQADEAGRIYGRSTNTLLAASGRGSRVVRVHIPDADLNDPAYLSTPEGGKYRFRAWLEKDGSKVSETLLPVRLLWGIRPLSLPSSPAAGMTYLIPVKWEELPSTITGDATPLSRASLWDSLSATQYYNLVLELRGANGQSLVSATNVTREGSGTNHFSVTIPFGASGPFSWSAFLQTASQTRTMDVIDGFEGRDRGLDRSPLHPWFSYVYSGFGNSAKLSEGVLNDPPNGTNKAGFMVVANPANPGGYSGFGIIRGTNEWSLPAQQSSWSNYFFSCDFKEINGRACVVQLQIKDAAGNWRELNRTYQPGANGWFTISGSLNQFTLPQSNTNFDRSRIREFVVNVQMLQTNATYTAYFDNILFRGPPDLREDFQNRQTGADYSRMAPWQAYGYDEFNHNDVLLDKGVQLEGSEGTQSAFVVAWNRTNAGNFAGFGMFRVFEPRIALPADPNQWRNFYVSFNFKEKYRRACVLEIQLKNTDDPSCPMLQRGRHFTKTYTPGPDGWDTIAATLDQFRKPDYFCDLDPSAVFTLVLNVQMLEKNPSENVIYVGSFDRIRFDGPETAGPGGTRRALYQAANDFFGFSSIGPLPPRRVTLGWVGGGILQWSESVHGPWTDITNSPPATLDARERQRFYRLKR